MVRDVQVNAIEGTRQESGRMGRVWAENGQGLGRDWEIPGPPEVRHRPELKYRTAIPSPQANSTIAF